MSHTVLLLEDDASNAFTLAALLEDDGFLVEHVSSCAEARALASDVVLDLALLDLNVADGRGSDLVPELRIRWPDAVLVLLTGAPDGTPFEGDAVIAKGLPYSEVVQQLRRLLGQRAATQAAAHSR